MANVQKCVLAAEASNDALLTVITKALNFPKAGKHVGGGRHVTVAPTWDGTGECPPGWTKQPISNFVNTPLDAALPIDDTLATALQQPDVLARISAPDQLALSTALAARTAKDLESAAYVPKVSATLEVAAQDVEVKS